jgi:L-amino acid N-acyltransferase YncA
MISPDKPISAHGPVCDIILRGAEDSDMAVVREIYAHHVSHGFASFETTPPSLDEMRRRRAAISEAGLPYIVAEHGGTIVGFSYAGPYRPRRAYRFTVEDSVYVAPDAQGMGVGSALLPALIARCEAGPWRQMIAVIGDSSNRSSVALHARFGFAPIGTIRSVGLKFGRWVDTVLMQRSLGEGDDSFPVEISAG